MDRERRKFLRTLCALTRGAGRTYIDRVPTKDIEGLLNALDEAKAEIRRLAARDCPGCLHDGLCRKMPDGAAENLRADRDRETARANASEAKAKHLQARCAALEKAVHSIETRMETLGVNASCVTCVHTLKDAYDDPCKDCVYNEGTKDSWEFDEVEYL